MKKLPTEEMARAIAKETDYTRRRELQHIQKMLVSDEAYNKVLGALYRRVGDAIADAILSQYLRYAAGAGLDINAAFQKAEKMDVLAFAEKAKAYVKRRDFSQQANEELKLYNLKMRTSRLELMKRQIELEGLKLYDQETAMLTKRLRKEGIEEIARQAGILSLSEPTRKSLVRGLERVINGDFHGAPFSSRVWVNKNDLVARLQVGLERSLLQGEHPDKWARLFTGLVSEEMGEKKGGALFAARRLAITESARVMSEIQLRSFEAGGFEKYIWIAELDERTCSVCAAMDNEVFDVDKSGIGANLPPLHPFCRCSVAAYVDDEESETKRIELSDERMRGFELSDKESEIVRNEGSARQMTLTVRDVKDVSYPMQISTSVSQNVDEAISYYQGQMTRLLDGVPEKLKQGELPKIVIVDPKELGEGLAMYSRANNAIFVNAATFDDERTLAELRRYEKETGTKFARSDNSLSTLAHEFGHRAIFEAAERIFGKEDILEYTKLYAEDLVDELLKEGYNISKYSSRYGVDELTRKKHEELLAESLTRCFLREESQMFQYLIERLGK